MYDGKCMNKMDEIWNFNFKLKLKLQNFHSKLLTLFDYHFLPHTLMHNFRIIVQNSSTNVSRWHYYHH